MPLKDIIQEIAFSCQKYNNNNTNKTERHNHNILTNQTYACYFLYRTFVLLTNFTNIGFGPGSLENTSQSFTFKSLFGLSFFDLMFSSIEGFATKQKIRHF